MDEKVNGKANFYLFIFGLVLILDGCFDAYLNSISFRNSAYFCWGLYLVAQNGFLKDYSNWRVKPVSIIIFSLVAISFYTFYDDLPKFDFGKKMTSSEFINSVVNETNKNSPIKIGENQWLMRTIAHDDKTLGYEFKLGYSIQELELDSIRIIEFENEARSSFIKYIRDNKKLRSNSEELNLVYRIDYLDSNDILITSVWLSYLDYSF